MLLIFIACACTTTPVQEFGSEEEWMDWRGKRKDRLRSTWGYMNLAGLYWLEEGENTFGSDSANTLVFPPEAPGVIGKFFRNGEEVVFTSSMGAIEIDSASSEGGTVYGPLVNETILMRTDRFLWYVLERSGKIGIRLLDLEHPKLSRDLDLRYYDYNPDFITEATYVEYPFPKTIPITDVLGLNYEIEIPGQLQFVLEGMSLSLEVMPEGDEFFLIFSDETSAVETYGSGRYMYAKNPGPGNKTVLDFNKSYCPPCAFTDYATCYIPPPENQLSLAIKAGELDFHWPEEH